jgi:tetrahydromethanopterin S-methyltransferase subunit B
METRTVEFFNEKVKQIDAKIDKCFKAFEEGTEHLHSYRLKEGHKEMEVESTYVSVLGMSNNIERLEELRQFYVNKINELQNPTTQVINQL